MSCQGFPECSVVCTCNEQREFTGPICFHCRMQIDAGRETVIEAAEVFCSTRCWIAVMVCGHSEDCQLLECQDAPTDWPTLVGDMTPGGIAPPPMPPPTSCTHESHNELRRDRTRFILGVSNLQQHDEGIFAGNCQGCGSLICLVFCALCPKVCPPEDMLTVGPKGRETHAHFGCIARASMAARPRLRAVRR